MKNSLIRRAQLEVVAQKTEKRHKKIWSIEKNDVSLSNRQIEILKNLKSKGIPKSAKSVKS